MSSNPRTQPTGVKIHVTTGAGVDIDWADGHRSHYPFDYLRRRCPCATCRHQREQAAGKALLPLYQETVRALEAEPVGHYAVRFAFSDAHSTGIYSFTYFREICPCEVCQGEQAKR